MPPTVQELLVLATQFEKFAADIPQPAGFEEDFAKWLKMKEKGPITIRELPVIKILEPKSEGFGKDEDDNDAKLGVAGFPWDVDEEDIKKERAKPKCDACDGEGYKDGKFCHKCEGSGRGKEEKPKAKAAAMELILLAKKQEKKLDPKAKVRSRGTVVFPAESPNVTDHKDHFPINDADQARNALARSHQYNKAPSWYKGSLKSLQDAVSRKVKSKYPKINVGGKDKKSSLEISEILLAKYAK